MALKMKNPRLWRLMPLVGMYKYAWLFRFPRKNGECGGQTFQINFFYK